MTMKEEQNLVCKRLPCTEDTLKFISPFFALEHVQKWIDDRWRTYYGIYDLFTAIRSGRVRGYGVFDVSDPMRFLGFILGWIDETGETFELHTFFDRDTATLEAINLCKNTVKDDYAKDGILLKYAIGYIPDRNRAAKWLALRAHCKDRGLRKDKIYHKGDYIFPCREYRFEW